jgi:hypothetical protein
MRAAISQMTDVGDEIAHLRERADFFRELAQDHAEAENSAIAFKLGKVARDLEARADELEACGRRAFGYGL